MENNDNKIKKNEQKKVMSRRSFFRRAAGMVLPAIALAAMPQLLTSCEIDEPYPGLEGLEDLTGCNGSCSGKCTGSCSGGCYKGCSGSCGLSNCTNTCMGGCDFACTTTCKGACGSTCRGLCTGTSKGGLHI